MNNLKINQQHLLAIYMNVVDDISEECDWKTSFGPKEIISIISTILEANANLIESDDYQQGYEAGLDAAYITYQNSGEL